MDHWYSRNSILRIVRYSLLTILIVGGIIYAYTWKVLIHDPLKVPAAGYDLVINLGTTLHGFTKQLYKEGLLKHPVLLRAFLIYKGNTKHIKAGEYRVEPDMNALQLLKKVFAGQVIQYSFTIIEGVQSVQMIAALHQHPKIVATLKGLDVKEILEKLQIPERHLEGIFLPDTYFFAANTTDVDFLRRAYLSMHQKLQAAWETRDANCILQSQYQALILASIIEKETSLKTEYAEIAGVYTRRLKQNMKLQADPTVIYGLPYQLSGPLLRKHLSVKSPYNTYLNLGLPPTPIALPSADAIAAALHPAVGNSLYFVATGDGLHKFSTTLAEHNKAVQQLYSSLSAKP